jgi:hypothetical protein
MKIVMQWGLPIVMFAIGIAIFTGGILPQIPSGTGLRALLGLVVMLFAIYRFAAARIPPADHRRRRYGGESPRPWEK